MFGPWFTRNDPVGAIRHERAESASSTQSVGVPSTWNAPSDRRCARSGRCSVSECDVPLCSRSERRQSPARRVAHDVASSAMPGASTPSSFETKDAQTVVAWCRHVAPRHDTTGVRANARAMRHVVAPDTKVTARAIDRRYLDGTTRSPRAMRRGRKLALVLVAIPRRPYATRRTSRVKAREAVWASSPADRRCVMPEWRQPVGEAAGDGHAVITLRAPNHETARPSSIGRSSRGISSGGCCPSASMVNQDTRVAGQSPHESVAERRALAAVRGCVTRIVPFPFPRSPVRLLSRRRRQ